MFSDRRPPAPGKFVEAGGLRWHYEEAGAGDRCLVLLHGYLGSTAVWRKAMARLGGLRVVALDLPGAGYTDRPRHASYTPDWMASLLPCVLDELSVSEAVLGGHSMGGSLALRLAAEHPARVSSLVLVAPLVYAQQAPPGLRFARKHPMIALGFFASPLGRAFIRPLVRRSAYAGEQARAAVQVQRLIDHLDAPGGWRAATLTGLAAIDSPPDARTLASVRQPTLIFWGEKDPVHPPHTADRLRRDLAGPTQVVLLPNAAHNAHEEQAELFASETLAWMGR